MKTIQHILILVVLSLGITTYAQMPRTISYQGVLADADGNFISDGNHTLTLKLYDASSTELYTETQTVPVVKGLFNVIIGSTSGLPANLSFDKAYYLGVGVDGGAEMTPRTALSASPYAFRAHIADEALALSPSATGIVTKVNNRSGSLKIIGGGATTVTSNNDTILISSSGGAGATGIQGVQNSDGALYILNPNGPVASINVAPGGIVSDMLMNGSVTSAKIQDGTIDAIDLADGSITLPKINSNGVTNGHVLTKTASGLSWNQVPTTGLVLPFSSSTTHTNTLFEVIATGGGKSGNFKVLNANNNATALSAESNGTGSGLTVQLTAAGNASDAISVSTVGTGNAGSFTVTNAASTSAAIEGTTTSTASGTSITNGAAGVYGLVSQSTPGTHSVGVRGINNSTTGDGMGVLGYQSGSGVGVFGETPDGTGVIGKSTGTGNGTGVHGTGMGTSSVGVLAENASSNNAAIALQVTNGYMKVSGGRKTAFQHMTNIANNVQNRTILNYPGMAQTDMLFVTHVLIAGGLNTGYGVVWVNNAWNVVLEANGNMPVGEMFNVLVIKQ